MRAAIRTLDHGVVAQLGERRVRNAEVRGSIPLSSTTRAGRVKSQKKPGTSEELAIGACDLYLVSMKMGKPSMTAALVATMATAVVCAPSLGAAQASQDDAAARDYFERGRAAFERADYERALAMFRHAYRLSERPELQYNIGVAADRLQREEEALGAFESYLDNTVEPAREAEVRERISALRVSIAEREATERALVDATVESRAAVQGADMIDAPRLPRSTIAGGAALAAIGAAGVTAMAVGLARDGSCAESVDDECVTEHARTPWSYVYGAVGLAALAGSATWFAVSARRSKHADREVTWQLGPTGVKVSGKF